MRSVRLKKPFVGGMVTDVPAHEIGIANSTFAQDGYSPQGVFKQRNAWAFDGSVADVADNLVTVMRNKFALADVTQTVTGDDDGDLFLHNSGGAGTAIFTGSVVYLARCVYRDEILFCAQDGITPLRRYSGVTSVPSISDNDGIVEDNEAVVDGFTFGAAPDPGTYAQADVSPSSWRVRNASTSAVTLDGFISAVGQTVNNITLTQTGTTFPGVSIYDAGTVTVAANTITGLGTQWVDEAGITLFDSIMIQNADPNVGVELSSNEDSTPANTSLSNNFVTDVSDDTAHAILRPCPFKDAASHKESLWGTGVAQYPNRVYVSPPGWNPSAPPDPPAGGGTGVFNGAYFNGASPSSFLLGFIDVPTPYDGDHNIAILSTPNPLLVLKRHAVYGVFGSYGGLSVDLIADGIGCLDIRSAFSYDEGQFWAGENGIFMYANGAITDLTAGKINREWRALTRDFDFGTSDYCTLGLASGHLVVYIKTGGGTTERAYLCDLRDGSWQSRVSNFTPRYMFTSRIPGEKEKLLAVSNDRQGRVIDFAPALDGSGTADDDAGSAPRFKAWTPDVGADGVDGVSRLVDVAIHANVYDAGAAGSTSLEASVVTQGGTGNPAASTKTLTAIESDTTDNLNRHHRRIARRGRLHQVRLEVDAVGTDTNATKVEVNQIDFNLRDNRGRAR